MNERIRELAKDCDLDWHRHWNDDSSNRLEKFAKLLIKECAEVAEDYDGAHYVGTAIKQHFGIKE